MKKKFISVGGMELAYLEKSPNAKKTIFFIHGNSGSSRMWRKQFDSELLGNYRLIAIDLPGHGKSAFSNDPENDYSPIGTSKILAEAIKELAAGNHYTLVGFSYGSNLVAEMLKSDVNPSGIIFSGSCVLGENCGMEKVFVQNNVPSIFSYNESDNTIVTNFLHDSIHSANTEDIRNSIEDYLSVSADFKPALFQTAAGGKISDEILTLQKQNIPVCLIFGQEDKLVNIGYLDSMPFQLWRNQIYKLPGSGHWANIDQSEMFDQLISDYIDEMFTTSHA